MKSALLSLAILCAAAAPALAQGKKNMLPGQGIDWQGDWDAAVKEATARNVPILYAVHKDN
jgi:hypothetical protein